MKPFLLALVCLLPISSTAKAEEVFQLKTDDPIYDFLMRKNDRGRIFVYEDANAGALNGGVRAWRANSDPWRVQVLESFVTPGSKEQDALIKTLSSWTGELRLATRGDLIRFLNDAADNAVKMVPKSNWGTPPSGMDGKQVERARALNESVKDQPRIFNGERFPNDVFGNKGLKPGDYYRKAKYDMPSSKSGILRRNDIHGFPDSDSRVRPVKLDLDAPHAGGAYPSGNSGIIRPPDAGVTPQDPIDQNATKAPDKL